MVFDQTEPARSGPPVLAIASGKGGTGKTTVAVNLAVTLARRGTRVVLADCDVEEPNAHLFLGDTDEVVVGISVPVSVVDEERCTVCGACRDACRFGAIRILAGHAVVFPELCHGCGGCEWACLAGAVTMGERRVGEIRMRAVQVEDGRTLRLVTGVMDVGEVKAPDMIRRTRNAALAFDGAELVIIDAPPGVACSAVAAIHGVDALLMVTEPTRFGMHDLELAVRLGEERSIPMAVVINRAGTGAVDVDGWAADRGIPVLASIPFDRRIAETYAVGGLLVDADTAISGIFSDVATGLDQLLDGAKEATP